MTYEKYALSENPFLSDSPDFPLIDRVEVMNELGGLIGQYIESRGPAMLALLGDYGIGKTWTLINIQRRVGESRFLPNGRKWVFAPYMKALPQDSVSKYVLYVYKSTVAGMGRQALMELGRSAAGADVQAGFGLPGKLRNLSPELAHPMLRLISGGSDSDIAWNYLSGEKVSAAELKRLGVKHAIDNNERARSMLLELLSLVAVVGGAGIILLVDEWEYVFTATGASRAIQLHNAFKEYFDRIQEAKMSGKELASMVFVFACTPSAWEKNIPSLTRDAGAEGIEPFGQRIGREYTIPSLSEEDTRKLVRSRLEKRRLRDVRNPDWPFTEGALKVLYTTSQGVPRRIVKRAGFLLEQALMADETEVSESFAKDKLESYLYA